MAGLVESIRGAGGGYVIHGDSGSISVGDILRAVRGKPGSRDVCGVP